jgi:hypothetical protein
MPMLLAIGLVGSRLGWAVRFKLDRLIPVYLIGLGVLLMVRGLPASGVWGTLLPRLDCCVREAGDAKQLPVRE